MDFETAAKILSVDEKEGKLKGEFWKEDDLYEVSLNYEQVLGRVRVEIEDVDITGLYVESHHTMSEEGSNRSYAGTEEDARLPETNEELEAYVLKSLNSSSYSFNL